MTSPDASDRLAADLESHIGFLRRLAAGLVARPEDAEDLVHETLATALSSPPRVHPEETAGVRAWLARVLRNRAANRRRDARRRAAHGARVAAHVATRGPEPPDLRVARLETARLLLDAVERLSGSRREALLLRYFEGLPPREIAARLDVPVGTVKTRLKRGLADLRCELDALNGQDRWRGAVVLAFGLDGGEPTAPGSRGVLARRLVPLGGALLMLTSKKVLTAGLIVLTAAGLWWGTRDSAAVRNEPSAPAPENVRSVGGDVETRRRTRVAGAVRSDPSTRGSGATAERALDAPSARAPAVVLGRVVDDRTGRPVADADVRWGMLARADPNRLGRDARPHSVRTDGDGRFRLEIAEDELGEELTLDVLAPGYGSAIGPMRRGVTPQSRIRLRAGETLRHIVRLVPSLHVAGVVVDVHGEPVRDVEVVATERDDSGYAYVASLRTDDEGRFAVHDFARPRAAGVEPPRAHLSFDHPGYLSAEVEDCHRLRESERASLRITLRRGHDVDGTVLSADGAPVDGLLVEAFDDAGVRLRAATTEPGGRFVLTGLAEGRVRLRVLDAARLRRADRTLDLYTHESGLELLLETAGAVVEHRHRLLGLELVDVTPELRAALDLLPDEHVLVTAADEAHGELAIGEIRPGDCFVCVGADDVTSVRQLVAAIVENAEHLATRGRTSTVRVVYTFARDELRGTNTQAMRVTAEQVATLRRWLERNP